MEGLKLSDLSEEIDEEVQSIEEKFKMAKNRFLLTNPKVIIPILSGLGINFHNLINNNYYYTKLLVISALFGISIRNSIVSNYILFEVVKEEEISKLQEKIRHEESFQLYLKEYQNFVSDYVAFLDDAHIISPTDVALFYRKCLKGGYFSINKTNIFQEPQIRSNEGFLPPEILGAKITTDTSVCRNNASFLTDVMNSKEVLSANLFTRIKRLRIQLLPAIIDRNYQLSYNHQITGFIENNQLTAYDATNDFGFNLSEINTRGEKITLGKSIDFPCYAQIYSKTMYHRETENREKLEDYQKASIRKEEWENKRQVIKEKYKNLTADLEDFWHEQQKKIEFLSTGYEEISVSKDQKIKVL